MEPIGSKMARWIENEEDVKDSMNSARSMLVKDRYDNLVFLFENEFAMRWFSRKTNILNCTAYYNKLFNCDYLIRAVFVCAKNISNRRIKRSIRWGKWKS